MTKTVHKYCTTLIKKKIDFSSYIRKFRMEQLQGQEDRTDRDRRTGRDRTGRDRRTDRDSNAAGFVWASKSEPTSIRRSKNQCYGSGSALILLSWIRIQEQGKWSNLTYKCRYVSYNLHKNIFQVKIQLFVTAKSDQDPDPHGPHRFGSLYLVPDPHWG